MRYPTLAASLAALTAATSLHAQTRVVYVDQTAPAGGDGTSWQRAFRSLNSALVPLAGTTVVENIEVRVAQGTYRPTMGQPSDPGFTFSPRVVNSGITISLLGSFAGLRGPDPDLVDFVRTPTTLSGDVLNNDGPNFANRTDNRGPVLSIETEYRYDARRSAIFVAGFHIRGGHFMGEYAAGGGLRYNHYGSSGGYAQRPILHDLVIEDCDSTTGGGLYFSFPYWYNDRADIRDCAIRNNRATDSGGGISAIGCLFTNCLIEGNAATIGGGAFLQASEVRRTIVRSNTASQGGGLATSTGSDGYAQSCLIVGNHAEVGGGCWMARGALEFCTISHNTASAGGGVHLWAQYEFFVRNSILVGNVASSGGHQLSCAGGEVSLQSCIMEGGTVGVFNPFHATITTTDVQEASPRFVDPAGPDANPTTVEDNDYHLRAGSPAFDAAVDVSNLDPYDLDGNLRVQPRRPGEIPRADLGCYEYQPHCPADTNQDDGVTVDDLLAFLTAYTFGGPLADVDDGSGTNTPDDGVTVEDLLYFLARYNQGC